MDLFAAIGQERRRLADLLESLTPEQWATQSCCEQWTVQETVGHMLVGPVLGVRGSLPFIFKARGNLAKSNDLGAKHMAAQGPDKLVASLREHADSRFTPPVVGAEAPLTDVVMHGQDIVVPLGLTLDVPLEHAAISLQTATSKPYGPFNAMKKLKGLRFEATDSDFTWGEGPTVSGETLPLAHAMWGRSQACDALSGEGADQLRRQLQG